MTSQSRTSHTCILILAVGILPLSAAAAEPAKAAPASEKDKAGWKSLFDGKSLDGWKNADFLRTGNVHVKDGAIVMDKGNQLTGVTYSRGDFPKVDYEVSLEGKKIEGRDFFCTTTFPVGDTFCSFVVGGWGGQVVGLTKVNGADAVENETTRSKEFKVDQWYRVRIRVTKDRILCWIDEEKMVDLETTDRKISIRIECQRCKPFGIATYGTTGAIRNIRVRSLTEADKKELEKDKPAEK
jgi:hypothetical protein